MSILRNDCVAVSNLGVKGHSLPERVNLKSNAVIIDAS